MKTSRFLDWLREMTDAVQGRTWTLRLPFQPVYVVTTNPENVAHVLKFK